MTSARTAFVFLLIGCAFALPTVAAQESVHVDPRRTVELLLKKFGEPDQRLDWLERPSTTN